MVAVRLRPKKLIICHIIRDSIREAILLINHESGVSHKRLFFFGGGGGGGGAQQPYQLKANLPTLFMEIGSMSSLLLLIVHSKK